MAKKLRVDELRTELAQRGLVTSGTKRILVRRLESALRKESKQSLDRNDSSASKKRPTDSENGDSNVSEKRLCKVSEDPEVIQQAKEEQKEKLVVETKKGKDVLDQRLPDHIKTQYHVLQQGEEIYDAMLNQTNVGENTNKFYVIQVLEADDGNGFMVYSRWGRIGVKGQDKLQAYTSRDNAVQEFEQKFYAKTKNYWSNRKEFICHPTCHTWLEMDYSERENESAVQEKLNSAMGIQLQQTELEPRIAKFISLICNASTMKQQMIERGYNAKKFPLGKLSKSTILKGYDVLKRIADVIGQSDRKRLEQLSGEFYTVIPHDFGFKKMREFVIDTPHELKCKLEMVEALGEIEVATKLLKDDIGMGDPLYSLYQHLQCVLTPVEIDSVEFSMIEKYMQNTHAKKRSKYTVDIVQLFKVSREGEIERFKKFSDTKNRMLLWHGSRLTNWTGILSQGLRIAPPEAPVTGHMFGKGVYFADMFTNSAYHCYATADAAAGVLLLCEVALGDMAELLVANKSAENLPEGKLSTKAVGVIRPDLSEAQVLEDGIVVPLGKPKEQSGVGVITPDLSEAQVDTYYQDTLLYNEYIVYNVDQIRMRYIVRVNFNFDR